MEKSKAESWRNVFANWPQGFKRKGVLQPAFDENIAFVDFVISDEMLVLERATPDNVGARRVMVPFVDIAALKFVEPLKTEQFLEAGYSKGNPVGKPSTTKSLGTAPNAPTNAARPVIATGTNSATTGQASSAQQPLPTSKPAPVQSTPVTNTQSAAPAS